MQENKPETFEQKLMRESAEYKAKKFERYHRNQYEYTSVYKIKAVVIGASSAGKTALLKKYVDNEFVSEHECTIGYERFSKKVKTKPLLDVVNDEKLVHLDILDTAGDEEYSADSFEYLNCAHIVIIVVAANQEPYKKVDQIRDCLNELERLNNEYNLPENKNTNVLVVETKLDLINNHQSFYVLTDAELQAVGKEVFRHIAVSAKTDENMDQFKDAIVKMVETVQRERTQHLNIDPHSIQTIFRPPSYFMPTNLPVSHRAKYEIFCHYIHSLNDVKAEGILINLKQFLINGNL